MQQASQAIRGEHDFAAFRSARSVNHTTVREITRRVVAARRRRRPLVFEIAGNGFLRYMVRSLVGTLVEIGRGQRPAERHRPAAGGAGPVAGRPDGAAARAVPDEGGVLTIVMMGV